MDIYTFLVDLSLSVYSISQFKLWEIMICSAFMEHIEIIRQNTSFPEGIMSFCSIYCEN